MVETTFEQVLKVALGAEEKAMLVQALQLEVGGLAEVTRGQLLGELQALLAAGTFHDVGSLRNQYPAKPLKYTSGEQLLAAIHNASGEWEADIEEPARTLLCRQEGRPV